MHPRAGAAGLAAAFALLPRMAAAHDAFGDLGPFYAGLLHPVLTPVQGLLLASVAVLLARQPLGAVRIAYPALVLAGVAGLLLHAARPELAVALRPAALSAVVLAALALWGRALPRTVLVPITMAGAGLAALAGDAASASRDGIVGGIGAGLGIAAFVLLLWGLADVLQARLGRVAGAVAAAWVIAIGGMASVLPG